MNYSKLFFSFLAMGLIVSLTTGMTACSGDDDDITLTHERNWLVVEDNPNDELDHTRYEIFEQTGIPIYYNDTIGSEPRTTLAGQPYTYYEVLQVFYNPGTATPSPKTANYTLPGRRADVLPVVEYLRDKVLPSIPKGMYVPSVLLVDTLNSSSGTVAFKGLNTIVLSNVRRFASMTEDARRLYRASFLRAVVASSLYTKEEQWLEDNFFSQTYAVNSSNATYLYSTASATYYVYKALSNYPQTEQTLANLGFIGTHTKPTATTPERYKTVPTKSEDVSQFVEAVLAYPEAEFLSQHKGQKVVLAKYQVLRQKLMAYGFELE